MKYHNVNGRRYYELEEIEWLKENYPHLSGAETTRLFNLTFNHNKTVSSLRRYCTHRLGLHITEERRKERYSGADVGYVFRNCRGEYLIKTESGWEKLTHHICGKVPKGYCVIHLNGDKDDNSPDNLMLVKNGIQTIMRNAGLWSGNKEISRTAVKWCELYQVLKEKANEESL